MSISCRHCPLRRHPVFKPLTADEVDFMDRFKVGELQVDAGTTLLMEGSNSPQLFTALRGMGLRYKTDLDGRRQVVNFVLPGDFIGLQAGVMREMRHSVEATTAMTLCVFNRSQLYDLFRHHSDRAFDLTWLAAMEESFLGEALTTVGQREAAERIAWAFAKLFRRARALGLATGMTFALPYRQQDLADALGLSLVHTNKTLARLRSRQIVSWSAGTLRIMSESAIEELAGIPLDVPIQRPLM